MTGVAVPIRKELLVSLVDVEFVPNLTSIAPVGHKVGETPGVVKHIPFVPGGPDVVGFLYSSCPPEVKSKVRAVAVAVKAEPVRVTAEFAGVNSKLPTTPLIVAVRS